MDKGFSGSLPKRQGAPFADGPSLIDLWRADLYDFAAHPACLEAATLFYRSQRIDIAETVPLTGVLTVAPVTWFWGRRFEFARFEASEGLACVFEVIDILEAEPVTVDLVAFDPAEPRRFATATGSGDALGRSHVENPAAYAYGPLHVMRDPLAWLRARCRGVVILNDAATVNVLGGALDRIAGEDADHALDLARRLHPFVKPERVVFPRSSKGGA